MHKIGKDMERERNGEMSEWSGNSSSNVQGKGGYDVVGEEGGGRESSWERCDTEDLGSKEECLESDGEDRNGGNKGVRDVGIQVNGDIGGKEVVVYVKKDVRENDEEQVNKENSEHGGNEGKSTSEMVGERGSKEERITLKDEENEDLTNVMRSDGNEEMNKRRKIKENDGASKNDEMTKTAEASKNDEMTKTAEASKNDEMTKTAEASKNDEMTKTAEASKNDEMTKTAEVNTVNSNESSSHVPAHIKSERKRTVINMHITDHSDSTNSMRNNQPTITSYDYSCYGNCCGNDGRTNRNESNKCVKKGNSGKRYVILSTNETFTKSNDEHRSGTFLINSINEQRYLMWCEIAIVYEMMGNLKMYGHAIENALKIRSGVEALIIYSKHRYVSENMHTNHSVSIAYFNTWVREHRRTGLSILLECYALMRDAQIHKFERKYNELRKCGRMLENEVLKIENTGYDPCQCVGPTFSACKDIIALKHASSCTHDNAAGSSPSAHSKENCINNECIDFFSDTYNTDGKKMNNATILDLKDKQYDEIRSLNVNEIVYGELTGSNEVQSKEIGTGSEIQSKEISNTGSSTTDNSTKNGTEESKTDLLNGTSTEDRVEHGSVRIDGNDSKGTDQGNGTDGGVGNDQSAFPSKSDQGLPDKKNNDDQTSCTCSSSKTPAHNFYVLNKHFLLFYLSLVVLYYERTNRLHLSYRHIIKYLSHSYKQGERLVMLFRLSLILKQRKDFKPAKRILNVLKILLERKMCTINVLDVHAQLAHLHFVHGAVGKCLKLVNTILHVDPHHLFSSVLKMECLFNTDVVRCAKYCANMVGRVVQSEYFLMRCYFAMGMFEQCLDIYRSRKRGEYITESTDHRSRTRYRTEIDKYFANTIGIVYFNLKDMPNSLAAFTKALSIDNDFREAKHNLAFVQHTTNSLTAKEFNVYASEKTEFREVMPSVGDPVFLPPYLFINCINK
ncbi:hypothetical protein VCUG_01702 [Vavraia culicis subsp. floridensis]|uniref:Uncharacterized protein n=1 Tax=Vavraia culicis (isolate floridensis) TaxID=948595 RepID=L2GTX0_VAVCU|nr:uncharacterized protein VCUG_01702 [Vavraia culicis subsp. floridensis]ELA46802.1 hypothetical protein VCUG_01702 [Vavraia culicis subsp. floridensis]